MTKCKCHESPQFDRLKTDVEVFADLDSVNWIFDRGYTSCHRFCELKQSDNDFVTLLRSDTGIDFLDGFQEIEVTDGSEKLC